jgi:hypothetical protein
MPFRKACHDALSQLMPLASKQIQQDATIKLNEIHGSEENLIQKLLQI